MSKRKKGFRFAIRGRHFTLGFPFLWLTLFFALPFAIVLKISFSTAAIAIPPYEPTFTYADQLLNVALNLGNYLLLLDDALYYTAYLGSLKIAVVSTLGCLLLGYPMAYAIARAPVKMQTVLLLLIMLPSWTSFLIRVYAWMGLLADTGLINNVLLWLGAIDEPLKILNTNIAVYIGIVYAYLPFMVLPLYANLVKMDMSLLEAAADLGSRSINTFWNITLPLSKGGVIAGSMLVFIPSVGEFVIPELLGGPDSLMIGKVLWQEFFNNRDWPVASALAIVMLGLLIIPITLFHHYQARDLEKEA
ncbi:ABC transporter permease subunit [Shewanella amazonensis]|uniref:Binding-protein-dependent transport systems inner membrane component n=1 Tax=Shewanella amazonensis (strain ATCC BAA-1098 / SB2B) TaxID=326297 RepID=A1S8Y6_SHEAM|nr:MULTISPECIES: ABC transporter permease subunit [Shewanella]ABM00843.1 binding-protein-dependent transport systems inner membrane component [Shewanella amazonensis SB2B]QYJ74429.1 ABC transporter permease subunit [Shewanella sp. FJAT-52076]QYK04301.1 ABC transporter permease subunit [Shewanella zhangzhouensis]